MVMKILYLCSYLQIVMSVLFGLLFLYPIFKIGQLIIKKFKTMKETIKRAVRRIIIWKMRLYGYKYLANTKTGEIHNLNNEQTNCHLNLIVRKIFLKEEMKNDFLNKGFNGCMFCYKEKDTDLNK